MIMVCTAIATIDPSPPKVVLSRPKNFFQYPLASGDLRRRVRVAASFLDADSAYVADVHHVACPLLRAWANQWFLEPFSAA